jgi:hypothetical protein
MNFKYVIYSARVRKFSSPERLKELAELGPRPCDIIIGYCNTEAYGWKVAKEYNKKNPAEIFGREARVSLISGSRTMVAVLTNPKATDN